jgi:hypothetical protein
MRWYRCQSPLWLPLIAAACFKVPQQSAVMERAGTVEVSAAELRELVVQFGREFTRTVEVTADSLSAAAGDPRVHYATLVWKTLVARDVRRAALLDDPLVALADVWALSRQMQVYFGSGAAQTIFGDGRSIALATATRLEHLAHELVTRVVGDSVAANFEPRLQRFVTENPIDPETFTRRSIIAADTVQTPDPTGGVGLAVAGTFWAAKTVGDRLGEFDDILGKELRWNLELLVRDLAASPGVDTTMRSVRQLLDRLGTLADTLPLLASGERAAVLAAMHEELLTALGALRQERIATVGAVSTEREAVMAGVTAERIAVLEAITRERIATLATVDSIMARALERSEDLVDHLFWRLGQLLALLAVMAVVGMLLVSRLRARGGPLQQS